MVLNLQAFQSKTNEKGGATTQSSLNYSAFGGKTTAPEWSKLKIVEKIPQTVDLQALMNQNLSITAPKKDPVKDFFKKYTPPVIKQIAKDLQEGFTGRGQEVDLAGNATYDGGLVGFFRPLGIGKSDYERYSERADRLMAIGVDPERAGKIAVNYVQGDTPTVDRLKVKDSQNKTIEDLNLTAPEKKALRAVAFWEGLDTAFGALDAVSFGTTKVGRTAISTIARSKDAAKIESILLKEIPELANDANASKGVSILLTQVNDPKAVEAIVNRIEFKYRGVSAGEGAATKGAQAAKFEMIEAPKKTEIVETTPVKTTAAKAEKTAQTVRLTAIAEDLAVAKTNADRKAVLNRMSDEDLRAFSQSEGGNDLFKAMETELEPDEIDSIFGKNGDQQTKAPAPFKGFEDLTIKTLEKLKGRTTVSKQFIANLTNQPDLKQAERDALRGALESEGDTVNVAEFAKKVKAELLPLNIRGGLEVASSRQKALKTLEEKEGLVFENDMSGEGYFTDRNGDMVEYDALDKRTQDLINKALGGAENYDQVKNPNRYESVTLPDDLRGPVANYDEHIYESPIKTRAGSVHFGNESDNYFAHTRIEDLPDEKTLSDMMARGDKKASVYQERIDDAPLVATRRVLEIQSDLFQRGRLEAENGGKAHIPLTEAERTKIAKSGGTIEERNAKTKAIQDARAKEFTKLEPYRNTWHERVIREEIKQAAIDGKAKLQFPVGKTAMQIEGLGSTDTWLHSEMDASGGGNSSTGVDLTPETMAVGEQIQRENDAAPWIITDVLGDGKFKAFPKRDLEITNDQELYNKVKEWGYYSDDTGELDWAKIVKDDVMMKKLNDSTYGESFDISGKVDTDNPIFKFYEKTVGRYLTSKFDAKRITDTQGVEWWEINVAKQKAKQPIDAFSIAGAPAGVQEDEEGNVDFNPLTMAMGMFAGRIVRKSANLRKLVSKSDNVPRAAYHGTTKASAASIAKEGFRSAPGVWGRGIYFAKDEEIAQFYADADGQVIEAEFDIQNPLELDRKYTGLFDMAKKDPELAKLIENHVPGEDPINLIEYAKGKGYDAIFAKDVNELVVFDDAQITMIKVGDEVARDVRVVGDDEALAAAERDIELEKIDDTLAEYNKVETAAETTDTVYRFKQLPEGIQEYLIKYNYLPGNVTEKAVMGMSESDIIEQLTPNADLFESIRNTGNRQKKISYKVLDGEMKGIKENIGSREFSRYFRKDKMGDTSSDLSYFATHIGQFSDAGVGGDTQAFRDELIEFVEKRGEVSRGFEMHKAAEKAQKAADAAKIKDIADIQKHVYTELTKKRYSIGDRSRFEAVARRSGEKAGIKQGWREAKTSITNQLRNTFDIKIDALKRTGELDSFRAKILERTKGRIRTELVQYAKENLPIKARGKFLTMVSQADSQRDLIKAFTRIDKAADEVRRASAIEELKKKIRNIRDSGQVAVDYKARVEELVAGIEFKGRREATLERLRKMEEFVEKQKAAGEDVTIPERLLRSLEILRRKPISELSLNEIGNIAETIDALEQLGRTKLATMDRLYEIEKTRRMDALLNEIRPIEKHALIVAKPGEKISVTEKFKNVFPTMLNMAQHVDMSLAPMDVFFDVMGGSPGTYESAPSRIFKALTDTNYGHYTDMKDKIIDRIWTKAENLGMTQSNFERIGVHAARVQESGMDKLANSGLTSEFISSIVLSPAEMEMYQSFRTELDLMRPFIEETMRVVYNKPLGKVENYFSFMTDWEAMSETEVFQRIGQDVPEFGKPTKNVKQGFAKARTGAGGQKIKLDAMEIFSKHIDNAVYLVHVGRDNKMLFEIANSPQFGEAAGDLGQKYTLQWLDLIARKGGKDGDQKIAILDALRRNVGVAYLGFKLTSALIQPTALLDGASEIGNWAFRGMGSVTTSRDVRQFILHHFPEIRARVGDDPAYLDLGHNETLNKVQSAGYAALKRLDGITASSVAWGGYTKKLDSLGIRVEVLKQDKEMRNTKTPPGAIYRRKKGGEPLTQAEIAAAHTKAMEYAQRVVRNTQASSLFKDAPQAISRGNFSGNRSLDKALFQFQTFVLRRWYRIRHDAYRAGIKQRNYGKAFRIFFYLALAYLAEEGIRRGSTELTDLVTGHDSSEEKNRDGYTMSVAKSVLSTIPFVSQGISVAVYQSDPVPALGALRTGAEGTLRIFEGKDAMSKTKGLIDLGESLGATMGIPGTRQASQLVKDSLKAKEARDKDPFGLDLDLDLDMDLDLNLDLNL